MRLLAAVSSLLLAGVLGGVAAGAQGTSSTVKDDLFNGTERFAKGASDVTEVTMDPDTLGMVSGDNARRAHGMVLNVVRTYEYDKPGMYNIADVEEIRRRLNTGEWHCSVHTQDLKHGESTDICNKRRSDGLVEQAIITVEPKELTFIHTIKHADPKTDLYRGGSGESMLIGPEMDEQMALLGARMAAIGPEIDARMASTQARIAAGTQMQQGWNDWKPDGSVPQTPAVPKLPLAPQAPAVP